MNILKITAWYPNPIHPLSGSFVEDQAMALVQKKAEVGVLVVDMDLRDIFKKYSKNYFGIKIFEQNGIDVFVRSSIFFPKINSFFLQAWARNFESLFQLYLKKNGLPDVLHAHSYQAAYAAFLISKKYKIPYVVTEHLGYLLKNDLSPWRKKIAAAAYQNAQYLILVSEPLQRALQKYPHQKMEIIPNAIDTNLFAPPLQKFESPTFQFLAIGDLIPTKGFDILLVAAAKLVGAGYSNFHLKIIGKGSARTALEKMIHTLQLENHIHFLGEISRTEVAHLMKSAHALIHPSRFESFGIIIIEAMATGLPVVATRCGGPEFILDTDCGILVEKNNADALFEGIKYLCDHLEQFDSKLIRRRVLERFSNAVVAEQLLRVYQDCLQK